MAKNIGSTLNDMINEAYAQNPNVETLDFVERLFTASLNDITDHIKSVLGRQFNDDKHQQAYIAIRDYCMGQHNLTTAVGILQNVNNLGDHDIVEYNIRVLARHAATYDNSWKFFKKADIIKIVDNILTPPQPTKVAVQIPSYSDR